MGKEQDLLDHILGLLEQVKGNPEKVLLAMDEYMKREHFMVIGRYKGKLILDEIKKQQPIIMLELGCYVGYSAILFGSELAKQNEHISKSGRAPARYYSFELEENHAKIARQLIDLAGLSDTVEIIVGPAGKTIPQFQARITGELGKFVPADVVFIDHAKGYYVPDLRVLESSSLIAPGTVILADNILMPGAPEYVEYVQSSPQFREEHNRTVKNISNESCQGRWNILYESETCPIENPETGHKDAVEVTKCVSYLSG